MSRRRSWRTRIAIAAVVIVAGWATRTGHAAGFGGALKWAWTDPPAGDPAPEYVQLEATPIVVSLNDDNGDGKVDQHDVPDIVFPASASLAGNCTNDAVLRAVSGADGTPLFGVFAPEYRVSACSPVAAGDIDGDGLPEIVAFQGTRLVAFENDGTFKWFSHPLPPENRPAWGAGPSIADLNHDGKPEIVLGASVFDASGALAFSKPCPGNPGVYSVVANLDLAGDAEIVCGFTAYRSNGDVYWDARPPGARSGVAAVADFDGDTLPEVVVVDTGSLYLFEHDGTPAWGPLLLSEDAVNAGAPVVADLTGDGVPDIGVAGGERYFAVDGYGNPLWDAPIRDSTSATSSAGFDFDGDGRTEIVHSDASYLRVFDGSTGAILFWARTSSCTWTESPVVADVDGDGSAEIVVPRNEACSPAFPGHGIQVFGDAAWAGAPGIWNEHAYHVTNVEPDGTIPAQERNNWQVPGLNNFRVNAFPTATQSPPVATDLAVTTPEDVPVAFTLAASDRDGDPLTFTVLTQPLHGTLSGTAPDLTYAPAPDFYGADSFTFQANDGQADSNVATVHIEVTPVDDAPTAFDQAVTTAEDVPVDIALVAADVEGDPLTYEVVTPPAHGTVSGTPPAVTYTPGPNYVGADAFTFRAKDGAGYSNVATVSINVTPVNDPPTADSQSVTTSEDTAVHIVLGASDIDGDALTYVIVSPPAHGVLSGAAQARTYTPAANYPGTDSFAFKVNDGMVDSNVATVTIVVTAVNHPPVAVAKVVGGAEAACAGPAGATVTLDATGSSDPDGDSLTFLWLDESGSVVGTTVVLNVTVPLGRHTYTLTVGDRRGGTATTSVTVVVGDTEAPRIKLRMSPSVLWPPNHKMVPVVARITVSDTCDAHPRVTLKRVTNSEDDGHRCDKPWISGATFGTDDRKFSLRAERDPRGPGRLYTVTYRVVDAAGNEAFASANVVVPHDRGHDDDHDEDHDED